jgi:hypothetical protein
MRFEFRQGVPQGAAAWLTMNVPLKKWDIRREGIPDDEGNMWYSPCVFVYDEQCATMFALMWLGK